MDRSRIERLARDVWADVFRALDAEPVLTGMDAGKVADACQRAFLTALDDVLADDGIDDHYLETKGA